MIETFFGLDALGTSKALFVSLLIGLAFGFSLERAGFGSSRRLAAIFYLRDMAVLKVMFTALIVAMLGLLYFLAMGWLSQDQIYFMPSVYGAQIVGGLLFGVGFVMSGWCPGTAAVGLASGKIDALVFLGGATLGSVLFNELFAVVQPLYTWGASGVRFAWQSLGMSPAGFAMLVVLVAVGCFWVAEYIEKKRTTGGQYFKSPFLKAFSVAMIILTTGLFVFPASPHAGLAVTPTDTETRILESLEVGADHVDPEDLANRLMQAEPGLLVVDIRTAGEFESFHLRGAIHVPVTELPQTLEPYKNRGIIVLYSNGMTHPAQARDALFRLGFANAYILTDGLKGFIETCLKPVSLRGEPLSQSQAAQINSWREYFLASPVAQSEPTVEVSSPSGLPGLVETSWLADNLGRNGLYIIDCRAQPQYNSGHIPGAVCLSPESVRGVVNGISSMLLPAGILAEHFTIMGIEPSDMVIIVPSEKLHDATLIGIAFERLGHRNWGILNGGFEKWAAENRTLTTALPNLSASSYPANYQADTFTVDYRTVLQYVQNGRATIIDVRPADYYSGAKSDEARAGHIPGAVNRPFTEDIVTINGITSFRTVEELAAAYAKLIPSKGATIIVHCRTGHQASQTFFVLRHLLGYSNVFWYDGGWSEWAARP